MKNLFCILSALIFFTTIASAQSAGAYFLTDPTLSPNGDFIVFAYEGDLWKVNTAGGVASRLTAMDGRESLPRISPDGKWLAFSGTQENNNNVYVMPVGGGEIKQLTFHESEDLVDSWSWDSKNIYFTSNRYNSFSEYKVSIAGGTALRLAPNFFTMPHHLVEHPVSKAWYFTETSESFQSAQRKRYKGDNNPDIESYDPQTKEFKVLTTYKGKDLWPTIDGKGNLYFVSDEANGEYNLYSFANNTPKALTAFETSIIRPQVSANGEKIVFQKDYQIFTYDVASGKSQKVDIAVFQNNKLAIDQSFSVTDHISYFDVSPNKKMFAFVSRGELFVSDIEGKLVKRIETAPDERVLEVKWLPDNLTLLYNQTVKGWYNLFSITADGKTSPKQLTSDEQSDRDISLSRDRSKGVYLSGTKEVRVIDLKTFRSETALNDEIWGIENATPGFSPNGDYIVFTAYRNFEMDILVHDLKTKKTIDLTNTDVTETEPFWSPDGKYIYFVADRTKPSYPTGKINNKLYRIPLQKFEKEFRSDKLNSLFKKESGKKSDSITAPVIIDTDHLAERWEELKVENGQQFNPYVIKTGTETTMLFNTQMGDEKYYLSKMTLAPFDPPKTEKIDGIAGKEETLIAEAQKGYYGLSDGNIYEIKLASNKAEKIKIEFSFNRNLNDEFKQMFYETWTTLKENYYDENFHGVDWGKMEKQYVKYLPFIKNRDNLRLMLNDMLGELNSSHMGFRSTGKEEKTSYDMKTAATGIIFENENPYKVQYILKGSPADNINDSIRPGDILTAVNGKAIDPNADRESYFLLPVLPDEMTLTFKRDGKTVNVNVHPQPYNEQTALMYDEWEERNQEYVDAKSTKRIAYIHMKDMSEASLDKFLREMTSEGSERDALILDLRYNNGGNVHGEVLDFLAQRPYLKWQYRGGKICPQPNFSPSAKPIILLVNARSLSDAEMTAAGFKALKLGKIVGTETYRWIIFTSAKTLVDGSVCRVPAWGCFTLNGDDLEHTGVAPDIYVKNTFTDNAAGKDPQLEKAVEEIMQQLKK
ncbi:MAG: S41 family peptidase [Bacteroidia bacterium]